MRAKTKALILLSAITVLDILPVPILALLLFYVVLTKPPAFRSLIDRLYDED